MKESKNNIPLMKIKPWEKEIDSKKIAKHKNALPTRTGAGEDDGSGLHQCSVGEAEESQ
jgi:hypothetical protein